MTTKRDPPPLEPSSLLFGDRRRRLLGLLMLRPERDFHVREIARSTGLDAANAQRELKRLQSAGLVTSVRSGNRLHFKADTSSPIFSELASIMRKTSGIADVLREALLPLADRIGVAFVFGSVAKGEEGPHSDVDLMVVGDVEFADVVQAAHGAQEKLGREVNCVTMKLADFKRKLAGNERFVTRLMAEPKLLLLGAFDEP
jgi:predicted nucleotidyltransferase